MFQNFRINSLISIFMFRINLAHNCHFKVIGIRDSFKGINFSLFQICLILFNLLWH